MSTTSFTSDWYEDIEVFSSDYEPATFEPGESVETNHALLGGLRDNDFEITDSAYTVREGCAASILWFLCVCQVVIGWLAAQRLVGTSSSWPLSSRFLGVGDRRSGFGERS